MPLSARSYEPPPDRAKDPVGRLVADVAELILEHDPTGRRRLTTDAGVAHALAQEIVDFIWEWDADA